MDLNKIFSYLDIQPDQLDKLKDFLEQDEVKKFLSKKWDEYFQASTTDEDESYIIPENETSDTPLNEAIMFIPNIPEDEETRSLQRDSIYTDPQDILFDQKLKSKHIQFQNGKVNQPYRFLFDITLFDIADIDKFWFEGLDELGLRYTFKTDLIEGTPNAAGDYKIILKCRRFGWKEGDPIFERPITLIINPDPRSLWNNIATPEDIEYYKPDSDFQYVKVEATKGLFGIGRKERKDIVAASQRGRSHAHEGSPRDDDFNISYQDETGWYLLAVADGAGSATYSREGSRIACDTVIDICNQQLDKYNKDFDDLIKDFEKDNSENKRKKLGDALYNILGSAVFKAYKNIEQESQNKGNQIKDYATTLLVTISKKFKFGWFIASFWVGDGGIGIYNKETQFLKIMGESDGGEFAGQTRFLTMSEVMQPAEIYKRLRFEIVEDFTALILMSDGVTDPKFETDANLMKIEKWNNLWDDLNESVNFTDDNAESAKELLSWLDFWSQGNHDDRTIAILY